MGKKNGWALIFVLAFLAIIRKFGVDNIPFSVVEIIIVLCIFTMIFSVLRFKGNKKERMYLIVMTIILIALMSAVIIAVNIDNNYPEVSIKLKPIFITIIGVLFLSLLIATSANVIYKLKNSNK